MGQDQLDKGQALGQLIARFHRRKSWPVSLGREMALGTVVQKTVKPSSFGGHSSKQLILCKAYGSAQ